MVSRLFESLAFQHWSDFLRSGLGSLWRGSVVHGPQARPSIFAPASTPAQSILGLSFFVLMITGGIFLIVGGTLTYVILR